MDIKNDKQKHFMNMVYAYQKGKLDTSNMTQKQLSNIKNAAHSMNKNANVKKELKTIAHLKDSDTPYTHLCK